VSEAVYDGLGRTVTARQSEGGGVWTSVETQYDGLGRVWKVSNPSRGAASEWTVTAYDELSRVVSVTAPGGAVTATNYSGATATVTDPGGKVKKLTRDGVGRVTTVVEAPGTGDEVTTSYTYNALDSLRTVNQAGQTRTFLYDTLGRLTSADNPETGVVNYNEYDLNGNLTRKTDARGVVTALEYDDLDRLKRKSYTLVSGVEATSQVDFLYDTDVAIAGVGTENRAVGRLTQVSNGSSTTVYRWDGLGRVLASRQTPAGGTGYVFQYTQGPAGLTGMTYPSGRVVTWGYDGAGRVQTVSGQKDAVATSYLAGITYAPHGGVDQMTVGAAGRIEQWCYNNRLQVTVVRLGTVGTGACAAQGGGDLFRVENGYGAAANNNGNVLSQVVGRGSQSWTESFTFDGLSRLTGAAEGASGGGTGWSRSYGYSAVGNGWVSANSGVGLNSFTPVSPSNFNAKNQVALQGATYDLAGNQAAIGGYVLGYDGEGRLAKSTLSGVTTVYEYDGEGRRVKRGGVVLVYDAQGRLSAEYGGTGQSGVRYLTGDHLGSTRVVTDGSGTVEQCLDYLPFGELLGAGLNGRTCGALEEPRAKFTGKERDAETGLDYFGARYFSGAQGRFTSPDPPLLDQHIDDPQSWNLYAYGRNNPLRYVDPTGNAIELLGDEEARKKELALLQKSLGNDKAASRVYINEVKDGDTTRYFVGIQGDVGSFMKMSDTSHDLANLVQHKEVVEFGLTSQDLSSFGGAVTYEKGDIGNQNVRTLVNPSQIHIAEERLDPRSIFGAQFWGKGAVNPFTPGVAAWHEFGHAWGYINGRAGDATNKESLDWENRMRVQLYGPLGPHNAPRIRHIQSRR
jgi:RHS repeat-associated protein